MQHKLSGIAASPGIAIGRAYVVDRRKLKTPKRHITEDEVGGELARFERAIAQSDEQLERVKRKLREREGEDHFSILEAHQLILHDEHLVEPTERAIRQELINTEWALRKTVEQIKSLFNAIEQDYFRERRSDVDFVGERILRNLMGEQVDALVLPPVDSIVVAHDLSPADTAHIHRSSCAAFVTDVGGSTSHSAILARAFRIPAVVGTGTASEIVATGDMIVVDGTIGEVILRPTAEEIEAYRRRIEHREQLSVELAKNRGLPAETTDGIRVHLLANVEVTDEIPLAVDHGAEGIGLYRTEFLYLGRSDLPREEEHFMHARGVLRRMAPFAVTFRTFDLGGEKQAPFMSPREANPALGLRSIRLCLRERGLFKSQLRGLLRASAHGQMRLMFPMISGTQELRSARAVLEEAKEELRKEDIAFDEKMPVGVMVEMPSAAMTADFLARECDFLSIGTNDLIQYSLAVDRSNEHVGYLYEPMHPAILRAIRFVAESAHAAKIPVGICGEMAGEPLFSLVLLGLGLDELSMNSSSIPIVRSVIRASSIREANLLTEDVMQLRTHDEILAHVRRVMAERFPQELLDAMSVRLPN